MDKKFRLRFCFEYASGWYWCSQWDNTGPNMIDFAWAQPKQGLVKARIEAKNLTTYEISTVAECLGNEFRSFEWLAAVGVPLQQVANAKAVTREGKNIGAVLVTKTHRVTVTSDGHIVINDN